MMAYCIRTCMKYKATKPPNGLGRCAVGQKRCQFCEVFIDWNGRTCPCCGQQLRKIPRSRKGKERYQLQRAEIIVYSPRFKSYI